MMVRSKQTGWLMAAAFWLAIGMPATAPAQDAEAAPDLDKAACLSCHDGTKGDLEATREDGEAHTLLAVDPHRFDKSVHADLQCIDCHTEITDATENHQKEPGAQLPDCAGCHQTLYDATTPERPASARTEILIENIQTYVTSFHAQPNADDETKPNATCNDCHNAHTFDIPPVGTGKRTEWRLEVSDLCGNCHEDQLEIWAESVHGRQVREEHNPNAAVCIDCHTSHDIKRAKSSEAKLTITESCGSCHEDRFKSYKATYHGKITTLGYTNTAKCYECHSGHDIEPTSSELSPMHIDNRLEACQECHNGKKAALATAGYVSFSPHAVTDDFAAYPQIWLADKLMKQLLIGTFAFFWLHTILWFFREYKERKLHKAEQRVRVPGMPEVPSALAGKHFKRFSRTWRIAHLLFALSLMMLTLTGIPLFFPEAVWAKPLMTLLGGPEMAGLIHRINAIVFAGVFVWHLFYMAIKIGRDWHNFRIFGPNSLIPGIQDLKDIIAMFKWFFGLAPRPVFDRWTYWEKFDYWAPFWGVTIIGFSGLLMWVPSLTAQYLPGWVFSVAAIFHSEEAFLAVVFLFTVHFFNNHFRPDKFPLDRVMFTGTMTLDELKHEHPLQYQRLLESGELEQHLVDPPSKTFVTLSSLLGFVLIVIGLTLLTLVGIGFFTHL
jgi:cytochrome b subunit of formate dehydrogenase